MIFSSKWMRVCLRVTTCDSTRCMFTYTICIADPLDPLRRKDRGGVVVPQWMYKCSISVVWKDRTMCFWKVRKCWSMTARWSLWWSDDAVHCGITCRHKDTPQLSLFVPCWQSHYLIDQRVCAIETMRSISKKDSLSFFFCIFIAISTKQCTKIAQFGREAQKKSLEPFCTPFSIDVHTQAH